jgi:cytochrome c
MQSEEQTQLAQDRAFSEARSDFMKAESDMRARTYTAVFAFFVIALEPTFAQDIAGGEKSWNKCRACHQIGLDAKNAVGPRLNGLFGRPAGSIEDYNYSDANKKSGIVWDEAVFAEYIKNPRAKIPNTKMVFPGIKNEQEINDLTAFLKQFDTEGKKK